MCCCVWVLVLGSLEFVKFILESKAQLNQSGFENEKCFSKLSEKQSVDFSV